MKKNILFLLVAFFIVVVLFLAYYFLVAKKESNISPQTNVKQQENPILENRVVDFRTINPEFLFSARLTDKFEVEYMPNVRAINIYDPALDGANSREKSQIYVSFFRASRFLTLPTVVITQQDKTNIQGREAILYEITKKESIADFSGQPSWRNFKHKALDIRLTKDSPSYFYSFASAPDLEEKIFKDIIGSLVFVDQAE